MLLCAAGDIHGAIDRMYEDVLKFEAAIGECFDWVLHVGDFGVRPDPTRIDKATRTHDGAGDFPAWLANGRTAPRRTVFIKGNHEDFLWLDAQHSAEVLPGLFYLRNGRTLELGESGDTVRVGGIGGCYGPSDFERPSKHLQGYAKRHCTHEEIDALCKDSPVHILLVHDAPAGVRFNNYRRGRDWVSEAAGLDRLIYRLRPLVCSATTIRGWTARWQVSDASASTKCRSPATSSQSISIRAGASGPYAANGPCPSKAITWPRLLCH